MRNLLYSFLLLVCISFSNVVCGQGWHWAKGNAGGGVDAWPVATDQSGNVYAAGVSFGAGPVFFGGYAIPYSAGSQDILVKYDPNGNLLWGIATQNSSAWLINIATDNAGNVLLLGTFDNSSLKIGDFVLSNTTTHEQYFLAKVMPDGSVLWAVNAGNAEYGATTGDVVVLGLGGLATDALGNAYVVVNFIIPSVTIGSTTLYNADPSGNTDDIMIAKYDGSGNVLWAKSIGGPANDDAFGVTVTPAGDIYIAGNFASPSIPFGASTLTNTGTNQMAFLGRLDASGNPSWAASSGGTTGNNAVGVASDAAGNVYMTGSFKENSIVFNGTTITNPTPGWRTLYLARFDPSNNVSWAKTINSAAPYSLTLPGGAWGYSIAMSKCGNVWVSGTMKGDSVNIDGHIAHAPLTGPDPIFIAGYSSSGVYAGSGTLPSGGDDQSGIACDATGNVYLCSDNWNATLVTGTDTLVADSLTELMYVAKFSSIDQDSVTFKHSYSSSCLTQSCLLTASAGYADYSWNNGQTSNTYTATDSGLYWVKSSLNCKNFCIDSFRVNSGCDCIKSLFVPNAFTPNGDGQDDVFYPRSGDDVQMIKSFRVYDRWGELLFERENISPNDATNAWDGYYKNEKPRPDVYVWIVDAVCQNGVTTNKKGSVTIIR